MNNLTREMANGRRKPPAYILSEAEIEGLRRDIRAIGADEGVFSFNTGLKTGYEDEADVIHIRGDVFPDEASTHPTDRMSERAVLAHEYYGHYLFAPSRFDFGDWRDEMRASYVAALKAPNLNDEYRASLILDAYSRARESGRFFAYSLKAREILYGYRENETN